MDGIEIRNFWVPFIFLAYDARTIDHENVAAREELQ